MRALTHPRDILMDLARCRERDLVAIIVGVRLLYVLYTLFCVYVLPMVLLLPPKFLVFDTGEWLYDDPRFTGVRNWDGVHFFHIARHGYSHENLHVFFPLVPLLIRVVSFLTQRVLPVLNWVAPVSFYVCAVNVLAFALAGVLLRRLTLLTFLGPEAHDLVVDFNHYSEDKRQRRSGFGKGRVKSAKEAALEAGVVYRVEHNLVGTMFDSFPSIYRVLAANEGSAADGTAPTPRSTHKTVKILWRLTGAAILCWVVTPSMVFTVAVYTESCFSFFTFAGVYLLARYPSAVGDNDGTCHTFPLSRVDAKRAKQCHSDPDNDVCETENRSAGLPGIQWKQAYTSRAELAAVLCFAIAALARSNAFACNGFLLYPTFIRLCFPRLYRRRWSCIHGHYCLTDSYDRASDDTGVAGGQGRKRRAGGLREVRVVRTLHPPHGRLPNPLRLLVLVLEVALVLVPYFAMNYHGWSIYVPMWPPEEQRVIGKKFWKFYGMLQKKYWNVGFLTAYTIVNSPNVLIGAPVAFILVYGIYHFYVKPSFSKDGYSTAREKAQRAHRAAVQGQSYTQQATRHNHILAKLEAAAQSLVMSSNIVYLVALSLIAFTLMHVQVANRFLMSCPALYWLCGFQLTIHPRSWVSKAILLFSIVWALIGGMLFPNHLPWT